MIEAARARRSLTYAEVLAHFGIRITPRRVFALCRDLGAVCERNRARGEPELAVLVVRKADRLPGEGFFHSLWRDGAYDGPATGPVAAAFIRRETDTRLRALGDRTTSSDTMSIHSPKSAQRKTCFQPSPKSGRAVALPTVSRRCP